MCLLYVGLYAGVAFSLAHTHTLTPIIPPLQSDKTQRTVLCTWLTEMFLERLNELQRLALSDGRAPTDMLAGGLLSSFPVRCEKLPTA